MTVVRSAARAARRAGSNVVVALDADAACAACPGDRREVHRTELGADADPGPAALLPHPDRPVALVVEDDHDDPGADPDRRLELGHRHRQAAVADERDDRAIAMDEGGRDGGRQAIAHRPGGRPEERARSPEAEPAGGPAREVPGIGRQDGVVGDEPAQRRRSSGPGGRPARPTAWRRRPRPPPRPRDRPGWRPARVATCAASSTARPRSRSLAALRKALASAATLSVGGGEPAEPTRHEVDVRPRQAGPRHRVAEGRRLVEPRPDDDQRVGRLEPPRDGRGGTETGHPEEERVVVRDDVRPPPGGDDRDLEELGEADQLGRGPSPQDAGAGQDDRSIGRGQQLDDRADLLVGRTGRTSVARSRAGPRRASARRAGPRRATG